MIRLIAFSPLEGAAFYEMDGKTFHTNSPFTPSVTEEVENAQVLAESTMGYMNGQDRTFENLGAMRKFLGDFQGEEIVSNPALKKNQELFIFHL